MGNFLASKEKIFSFGTIIILGKLRKVSHNKFIEFCPHCKRVTRTSQQQKCSHRTPLPNCFFGFENALEKLIFRVISEIQAIFQPIKIPALFNSRSHQSGLPHPKPFGQGASVLYGGFSQKHGKISKILRCKTGPCRCSILQKVSIKKLTKTDLSKV